MKIEIVNFPMPPSVNKLYANTVKFVGGGRYKTGRRKSDEYQEYVALCNYWYLKTKRITDEMKDMLNLLGPKDVLGLEITFNFYFKSLYCTSKGIFGRPKKMDLSNKVKALEDQLCRILAIDDSLFRELTLRSEVIPDNALRESADIKLYRIDNSSILERYSPVKNGRKK